MKINWKWILIFGIVLIILLTAYGLLWGFSGEGSKIIQGNVEEDSFIGKGVDIIEGTVNDINEEDLTDNS